MKSISLGAQSILLGDNDTVVVGGMENMSQVPHYYNARNATKLGNVNLVDGMIKDGLTDVYNEVHMCTSLYTSVNPSLIIPSTKFTFPNLVAFLAL